MEPRDSKYFPSPPGTSGEGWGEGDFEDRNRSTLEITLTLTFSREYRERG
jgi:hypothetical protein